MDDNENDGGDPSSPSPVPRPHYGTENDVVDSFTQIQTRRFRSGTRFPCWSLCPSMDLVALATRSSSSNDADAVVVDSDPSVGGPSGAGGRSAGGAIGVDVAESMAVHRILSWQTLLTLKGEQLLSSSSGVDDGGVTGGGICVEDIERESRADAEGEADEVGDGTRSVNDGENDGKRIETGATSVRWSPDGRHLAVGLADGGVLVHTVEPDANGAALGATHDAPSGGDADGLGGRHGALVIRPPPSSPPAPPPPSRSKPASPPPPGGRRKRNDLPMFSPRVTRSMAAAGRGRVGAYATKRPPRDDVIKEDEEEYDDEEEEEKEDGKGFPRQRNRRPAAVVGMAWSRLRPRRPSPDDDEEQELRESWRHRSQLVDRGSRFLPTNNYATNSKTVAGGGGLNLSSSTARLNVLCVATTEEVHWYLQGQYRILSVPHGGSGDKGVVCGVELACAPDLSALLAVTKRRTRNNDSSRSTTMKARLYGTPLITRRRFDLQILSASYRSIFSHLWDARRGIRAALDSLRTALRPLDTKFQSLLQLLSKYGAADPHALEAGSGADIVRLELLRFILSGRSTVAGDASGALDQFFTRPQMHDQFLQREARGVEAGVAGVEGTLRSRVIPSVLAAVHCSEELYGWARGAATRAGDDGGLSSSEELVAPDEALRLYASSRVLFLILDRCVARVIEARCRLRDLLAWTRGAAARVRARGTAADSVQRKNARARRVGDGVARRVAGFLSGPVARFASRDDDDDEKDPRGLTECVIGMPLSDFFVAENSGKPRMTDCDKENVALHGGKKRVRSLESMVQSIFRICTDLFDRPRSVFAQSLTMLDICFEAQHSLMAIHTRIGIGPDTTRVVGGDASGFFMPKTNGEDASIEKCPFWWLFARFLGTAIEVIAIPGRKSSEAASNASFFLRANFIIPEGSEVSDIVFYGDDGMSSLSPSLNDDAEIREGRQSIGCVMKCKDPLSSEVTEELWLFEYDDVIFKKFDFERNLYDEVTISAAERSKDDCTFFTVLDEENSDAASTVVLKRRLIGTQRRNSQSQHFWPHVNLCGSRGTGGVITFGASTSLNIFDLEEDEDNASSGEDNDDCQEEDGSTT